MALQGLGDRKTGLLRRARLCNLVEPMTTQQAELLMDGLPAASDDEVPAGEVQPFRVWCNKCGAMNLTNQAGGRTVSFFGKGRLERQASWQAKGAFAGSLGFCCF